LRRATFYLHYKDKEELLLTILRETFDEIRCEFHKLQIHSVTPQSELEIYRVIFKHAAENANLYMSILRGYGAATITRYIREYLTTEFLEDFAETSPDLQLVMPLEVLANFSAIVKLNMATWWLEQGMPYPPDQIAEMCMKLTLSGAQAAFVPKQNLQPAK
jgi:AcrR family transcriptional regulator